MKAECNEHEFSKSVYDMELHEELLAEPLKDITTGGSEFECLPLRVLRVPGGWLYYNMYASNVGVFVPFDNKFKERTKNQWES